MKEFTGIIKLPVYGYVITVIITEDIDNSRISRNQEIGEFYQESENVTLGLHSYVEKHLESYIFINPDSTTQTIVHECFHCTAAIMSSIGSCLDSSSEEVYAYTLGYLTAKVEKFLKNSKKKFKKKK